MGFPLRPSAWLLLAATTIATVPAHAEDLDLLMNGLFTENQPTYIGYDSVAREDIPASAPVDRKYLIVDFRFTSPPANEQLQASVHKICMTLIRDRELIRTLSDSGYDMVSVAFDRASQYDCL